MYKRQADSQKKKKTNTAQRDLLHPARATKKQAFLAEIYRSSATIKAGFSTYCLNLLEKRAMVAPSTTRWSADQDTFITDTGATTASPLEENEVERVLEGARKISNR